MPTMRVLELYSGIGGMHCALSASGLKFSVVSALDINDLANGVYNSVFGGHLAKNRTIDSLSAAECRALQADLWTLSPPCQPFTRMGKRRLGDDNRSSSLHAIMELIKIIKPAAILFENVKGFDSSDAWKSLLQVLFESGYDIRNFELFVQDALAAHFSDAGRSEQFVAFAVIYEASPNLHRAHQFLLTPLQFGIPNCRLRYYLVGKQRTGSHPAFAFGKSLPPLGESITLSDLLKQSENNILRLPPVNLSKPPGCCCAICSKKNEKIISIAGHYEEYLLSCRPLSEFLLPDTDLPERLILSEEKTKKFYRILDLVTPESRKSACFTKGYSQRFEGTGSFLKLETQQPILLVEGEGESENLPRLRYFDSKEIANLMCFPSFFDFPPSVTEKQRIRLLGNSINVLVVAHIMHWAFSDAYIIEHSE